MDDQGVKLVEELVIMRKRGLESGADLFVGGLGFGEAVALEHPPCVGVNDKDGMFAGIEEDGVGRFGSDAAKSEKLFAEDFCLRGEQAIERAAVLRKEKGDERPQRFCFLAEVAGWAKASCELCRRGCTDCSRREQFLAAKIGDGPLDVFPGRILRKDGAGDDFKPRATRPPVLRAMSGEESVEVRAKDGAASRRDGRTRRRFRNHSSRMDELRIRGQT